VERALGSACLAFAIEPLGFGKGVRIEFDDGTELRALTVELLDALKVEFGEAARRPTSGTKSVGELGDGDFVELEGGNGSLGGGGSSSG
jgi:hypothetical protein